MAKAQIRIKRVKEFQRKENNKTDQSMMISSPFFSLLCFSLLFPFLNLEFCLKTYLICSVSPLFITPLKFQNNQLKLSKSGPGPTWLRAVRSLLRAAGSGGG